MPPERRELRVFISSTFRDMHAERDELVKRVFPQIRKLCEDRDVAWSEVDLRWGVTDEERAEGAALPLCLAEIDKCRPYFLCLLGERYGWIPENVPEGMLEKEPWLRERLDRSVTELEILHAALNDPRKGGRAFFYLRDPAWATRAGADPSVYLERPWPSEIATLGQEEADRRAAARRAKLADLKRRIRDSGLPVQENYRDPKALGDLVLQDLTRLIERLYPAGAQANELDREAQAHESYARARMRTHVRRAALEEALATFAAGKETTLVVTGEAGSGKTAALAEFYVSQKRAAEEKAETFLERLATWITGVPTRPVVIAHFVGASPASAEWKGLVKRILGELKRRCRIAAKIPDDPFELRYALEDWLPIVPDRLVLILDGLDRLDDDEGALDLDWLPKDPPSKVRIAASAAPGRTLDALRRRGWFTLDVPPLAPEERREFVAAYLDRFGKKLAPQQVDRIAQSPRAADPLFLSTLLDELRLFGFHENLEQRIGSYLSSRNAEELYLHILHRYEEDYESERPGLIRDALSLLWVSRRGLTEAELLDLLGEQGAPLPRLYLAPFLLAAQEWFASRAGALALANESLRRAVRRRYLENPAAEGAVRAKLARYLRNRPNSRRGVEELLWQQSRGGLWEELRDSLIDFDGIGLLSGDGQQANRFLLQMWEALDRRYDPGECYVAAAERFEGARGGTLDVAVLFSKCGELLHSLGRPAAARALCQRALAIREREGDADVGDLLGDLCMIGRTYQVENRLAEALQAFERASVMSRKKYGKKSAEYATLLASIGGVHYIAGDLRAALEQIGQAREILERANGPEDETVLALRDNLATVLRKLGNYAEAGRHVRDVYEIRRRLHGEDHPSTVTASFAIASLLLEEGGFGEAIPLYERALALRERALGPDHPGTVNTVHNLAVCYQQRGEAARAKLLFERASEATKRRFGDRHPDYATEAFSLAECRSMLKEFDRAEELYREALAIFEESGEIVKASTCMHSLGAFYVHTNRPAEGKAILLSALRIREERLGQNHDETGVTWFALAAAEQALGDAKEARACVDRGLSAMTTALGAGHRKLLLHGERFARAVRHLGQEDLARYLESRVGLPPTAASSAQPAVSRSDGGPSIPQPSPASSGAVDPVRSRTLAVFRELDLLAQTGIPPSRFFEVFLPRLVFVTGAAGGAVWRIDSHGDLHCDAEANLPDACRATSDLAARHLRFVSLAGVSGRYCTARPNAWMPDAPDTVNPTPYLLRLVGLPALGRPAYVCELAFDPEVETPTIQAERNAAFQRGGRIAADYLGRLFPAEASSPAAASSPPAPPPAASTLQSASANGRTAAGAAVSEAGVAEARQRIQTLVEEVRVLAGIGLPPEVFLKEFLSRLVRSVGAGGGAIWNVTPIGEPRIEVEVQLPPACRPGSPDEAPGHRDLIRYVAGAKAIGVLRAGDAVSGALEYANHTPYLLLIGYLEAGDQGTLICEVATSNRTDPKVIAGIRSFLVSMREIAAEPVRRYYSGRA